MNDVDLAYLAAIWDGEGSFMVDKFKDERYKGGYCYSARSQVCNTNKAIVDKVTRILNEMDIKYSVSNRKDTRHSIWKEITQVRVGSLQGNKTLLENLIPFLSGKQAKAKLVLDFVLRRLDNLERRLDRTQEGSEFYAKAKIIQDSHKDGDVSITNPVELISAEPSDVAYLAGMFDGEGNFCLQKRDGNTLRATASIGNTNPTIINRIREILQMMTVTAYFYQRNDGCYVVNICRLDMNSRMLAAIIPYLTRTQAKAKILLEFVNMRLAKRRALAPQEEKKLYTKFIGLSEIQAPLASDCQMQTV